MTIELVLTQVDNCIAATYQNKLLSPPTPVADLVLITPQENPYRLNPFELGGNLFEAMGGQKLLNLVEQDADQSIHLITDEAVAHIPWEYAVTPNRRFLATTYDFLRLLPQSRPSEQIPSALLNVVILAADPLISHSHFAPHPTVSKLAIDSELRSVQRVLNQADKALKAKRIPPTKEHLQKILTKGPTVLHLSCHCTFSEVDAVQDISKSQQYTLFLEDKHGVERPLTKKGLAELNSFGTLRLVIISPSSTLSNKVEVKLARKMVLSGIPAIVVMQGHCPDHVNEEFAATLYKFLLKEYPLGRAIRAARLAISELIYPIGLPVVYVAPDGWQALPLQAGSPSVAPLNYPHYVSLSLLQSPEHAFLGRQEQLHHLAHAFSDGHKVVTLVGSQGTGKRTLATAFAKRFGWYFEGGVIGASLRNRPSLNPNLVLQDLLEQLLNNRHLPPLAGRTTEELAQIFLEATYQRAPLIVLDNYQIVLNILNKRHTWQTPLKNSPNHMANVQKNAQNLHNLVEKLAKANLPLLLTSDNGPLGLPNEITYPKNQPMAGLNIGDGETLFLQRSKRSVPNEEDRQKLAKQVALSTQGHPMAIILLAAAFDVNLDKRAGTFLDSWYEDLAVVQRKGLTFEDAIFTLAFERNFQHLNQDRRAKLLALSCFHLPFFPQGAALVWGYPLPQDSSALDPIESDLRYLVRHNLLKEGKYYKEYRASVYYLEPVIAAHLHSLVPSNYYDNLIASYLRYTAWLVDRAYQESSRNLESINSLALQWADEMIAITEAQPAHRRAKYCWQLGALLKQYNRFAETATILDMGENIAKKQGNETILSAILAEQADFWAIRGNLVKAFPLYEESIRIKDKVGDLKGKAVTLHNLAELYTENDNSNKALSLYQESLEIKDRLSDLQGKAISLLMMAQVYAARHNTQKALALYQESLDVLDEVGDLQGKGVTYSMMANIFMGQRRWPEAKRLVEESLEIAQKTGLEKEIAFNTVKLGQICQVQGDQAAARYHYQTGLAIFKELGLPETDQVQAMLVGLEDIHLGGGPESKAPAITIEETILTLTKAAVGVAKGKHPPEGISGAMRQLAVRPNLPSSWAFYLQTLATMLRRPERVWLETLQQAADNLLASWPEDKTQISLLLDLANICDQYDHLEGAIHLQTKIIAYLRRQEQDMETLQSLSITLYNQASYLTQLGRIDEAMPLLEEVVAIDEQLGLADLEADQAVLKQMKRHWDQFLYAETGPSIEIMQAEMVAQLAELPLEGQALLRQVLEEFPAASPDEQESALLALYKEQVEQQAEQLVQATRQAYYANHIAELLPQLEASMTHFAQGEVPNSPYVELADFIKAVIALLRGGPLPSIPATYAEKFATLQKELNLTKGT